MSNQVIKLPRIIPHLWTGLSDVAGGSPEGCSFCGESDPAQYGKPCSKRSSETWYGVLGVPEGASETDVKTAFRHNVKDWHPDRLHHEDDKSFDSGYSETQMKWFNAAYAVLGSAVKRRQYDAELRGQRTPKT